MAHNGELGLEVGRSLVLPLVICSLLDPVDLLVLFAKFLFQLGDGRPSDRELTLSFPQLHKLLLSLPLWVFNRSLSTLLGLITLRQLEKGLF